jgi:hypothetical protein
MVERFVGMNGHTQIWDNVLSTVFPNFNYAKVQGSAPFNLLIELNEMKPLSPTLIKISLGDKSNKTLLANHSMAIVPRSLRSVPKERDGNFVVRQGDIEVHFFR